MNASNMVTVVKVGRKYEIHVPGHAGVFATKTSRDEACALAWTIARYRLRNPSMFYVSCIVAVGFSLPE
jgi:hypothetical protein